MRDPMDREQRRKEVSGGFIGIAIGLGIMTVIFVIAAVVSLFGAV